MESWGALAPLPPPNFWHKQLEDKFFKDKKFTNFSAFPLLISGAVQFLYNLWNNSSLKQGEILSTHMWNANNGTQDGMNVVC